MKKTAITLLTALIVAVAHAQSARLVKLWETPPDLKTPESVLFEPVAGALYVSNMDGKAGWTTDNQGSVAKVGLDGKIIALEWITGLDNPKGLGLHEGLLYVADMTQVVVIDVAKAVILEKIAIPGAERLNDITIDPAGVVYVSDTKTGSVHALTNGKHTVLQENLPSVNGLLAADGILYILSNSCLFERSSDGRISKIADGMEGGVDGLVKLTDGSFIVSCWPGTIHHVLPSGEKTQLLNTRPAIHSADIGCDLKTRTLYVPTFFENTVAAYRIE